MISCLISHVDKWFHLIKSVARVIKVDEVTNSGVEWVFVAPFKASLKLKFRAPFL